MDRDLNIFFDVDETLVMAFRYNKYLETKIKEAGYACCMYDRYLIVRRNTALDMLAYARIQGNVFVLTQGGSKYFHFINFNLGLGFNSLNAYTFEDIAYADNKPIPAFAGKKNILIDNLTYQEQQDFPLVCHGYKSKIKFLDNLPEERYYAIQPYEDWYEGNEKDNEVRDGVQSWIDKFVC